MIILNLNIIKQPLLSSIISLRRARQIVLMNNWSVSSVLPYGKSYKDSTNVNYGSRVVITIIKRLHDRPLGLIPSKERSFTLLKKFKEESNRCSNVDFAPSYVKARSDQLRICCHQQSSQSVEVKIDNFRAGALV